MSIRISERPTSAENRLGGSKSRSQRTLVDRASGICAEYGGLTSNPRAAASTTVVQSSSHWHLFFLEFYSGRSLPPRVHRPDVDGNQPALELHNSISFLDGLPLSVNHRRTRQKISLIGLFECHQGPWYHPGQLPSYLQAVMSPPLHTSHAPEICLFLTPACLCSGISMDSGKVWNVRIVAGNGDLTILRRRFTSQKEAVGR